MATKTSQITKTAAAAGMITGTVVGGTGFLAAVGAGILSVVSGGLMADVLMEGVDHPVATEYKRRKQFILDGFKKAFEKPAKQETPVTDGELELPGMTAEERQALLNALLKQNQEANNS
jgi:hypothetical protein